VVIYEGYRPKPPPKKDDGKKNDKKGKGDKKNNDDDEVSVRPDRATVVVKLPADAKLYVDDVLCPMTSNKRSFRTPRLEQGRRYYYTLKVEATREGKPVKESRRVYLEAGKKVNVDFGEMSTVSTAKKR
jgi:uncharacterized protein (TIGR03000 family)